MPHLLLRYHHLTVLPHVVQRQREVAAVLERPQNLALGHADLVLYQLHLGLVVGFVAAVHFADDVVEAVAEVADPAVQVFEFGGEEKGACEDYEAVVVYVAFFVEEDRGEVHGEGGHAVAQLGGEGAGEVDYELGVAVCELALDRFVEAEVAVGVFV
jgi:hypothetical protein